MRQAARVIMDQRTSRVASRPSDSASKPASKTASKTAPKLELNGVELFTDEQPKDIFVPLPKDLDIDSVIDSIE